MLWSFCSPFRGRWLPPSLHLEGLVGGRWLQDRTPRGAQTSGDRLAGCGRAFDDRYRDGPSSGDEASLLRPSASWQVTVLAPEGRLTHVFVAPRRPGVGGAAESDPVSSEDISSSCRSGLVVWPSDVPRRRARLFKRMRGRLHHDGRRRETLDRQLTRRGSMSGRCLLVAGLMAISGCGSKLQSGTPGSDGSSSDGAQPGHDGSSSDGAQPVSCTDTVEHGCQTSACAVDWTTAIANVDCANGTYASAQCGGYDVLRFLNTNVGQVDPHQTYAYYSQTLGLLVASTSQSIGPYVECALGPAGGFVVPDCAESSFVSLCETDAGSGVGRADAGAFPPPFTDAGCIGDPRLLTVYCETSDQLLGTDAGRAVTSPADCPPSSVLASPSPCAVGEGSCCRTPACGPRIEAVSAPASAPDASATENRCCYLAQIVCGV